MARGASAGFSLVEAMVSSLILGFGVLVMASMYSLGARSMGGARTRDAARLAVQQRLETLAALGTEALPSCGGEPGCLDPTTGRPRAPRPPADGFPCSQYLLEGSLDTPEASDPERYRFRLDTVVWAHPSEDQGEAARVVEVSACWLSGQHYDTLRSRRLVLEAVR